MPSGGGGRTARVTPRNREHWRDWLRRNHANTTEIAVVFYKKAARGSGRPILAYGEAVEEALCFGWIDGIKKRLDDERYSHRFTPRKPESRWSETNRRRVERLRAAGRMTPAGERLVEFARRNGEWDQALAPRARPEFPAELAAGLDRDPAARAGWEELTPSERRRHADWIAVAKREATRARRLAESLELLRSGRKLGMR